MSVPVRHLQLDRPLAVLDLETTGLDPAGDRVVEVAALKVWPDGRTRLGVRRVKPGRPIPQSATAVHGITDADVAGCPSFPQIAPQLVTFLAGCDLAGYNLPFDLGFLNAELVRSRLPPLDLTGRACVDVLSLFRRQKPHTLVGAVAEYLGATHPTAHTAAGDVAAIAYGCNVDTLMRHYVALDEQQVTDEVFERMREV